MPTALLLLALLALRPALPEPAAAAHVAAAVAASAPDLPPEVLLGVAAVESGFSGRVLSWRECAGGACRRRTGPWRAAAPPPGAVPSWYCGATQVGGYVPWARCAQLMADVPLSYRVAAAHLHEWARLSRVVPGCRGATLSTDWGLRCALRGYNGGFGAVRRGSAYPDRVLRFVANLRRIRVNS
jgi:hypothetical protein